MIFKKIIVSLLILLLSSTLFANPPNYLYENYSTPLPAPPEQVEKSLNTNPEKMFYFYLNDNDAKMLFVFSIVFMGMIIIASGR